MMTRRQSAADKTYYDSFFTFTLRDRFIQQRTVQFNTMEYPKQTKQLTNDEAGAAETDQLPQSLIGDGTAGLVELRKTDETTKY
jgi:hypothetical protein